MKSKRNYILAADTAVVAASNALVLLAGARLLDRDSLTTLSMAQLLVVTIVGLQRAAVLTPAFATQRTTGRTVIPIRWMLAISLPVSLLWCLLTPLMTPSSEAYWIVFAVSIATTSPVLAQDLMRFALFTRLREKAAFASDVIFFVTFAIFVVTFFLGGSSSWIGLLLCWGVSGLAACLAALFFVFRDRASLSSAPPAKLSDVVKIGKWSGSDAALSGAANLLPMVVSSLSLGSPVAAVYRLLQTANGPFNILSATFLTSVGMDAWKLEDRVAVVALRNRSLRQSLLLACVAAVFYGLAYPAILILSGITDMESVRVALILAFSGVLGAATIPITAAASAMGYQKVGFIVRVAVVISAVAVSLLALTGAWIPWGDPVGVVAIVSGLAGFVGWAFGYERGYRREMRDSDPGKDT